MYVVALVALVCTKSWSPSRSNDVPLIPSVSVIVASSLKVSSSVLFSNCQASVAFGRIVPFV